MKSKYKTSRNCVYNINFHIVWTTKYIHEILCPVIQESLKHILFEKATKLKVNIRAIEIMSNHVHLFISTDQLVNLPKIINIFKGFSSYALRKKYDWLSIHKSIWTNSYFCESIGHISQSSVIKYIMNQKNHI